MVGIRIEENISNALTSVGGSNNSRNIGLLMERTRGVENRPYLVKSLKEDRRLFGGNDGGMYSPYVVESLFSNSGGFPVNLYGIRVVGTGSLAAKVVLKNEYPNTQEMLNNTVQLASPTQKQIQNITPIKPTEGDNFTVVISGTSYTYVVQNGDEVVDVVNGLFTAVTHSGITKSKSNGSKTLVLTSDTDNTPFTCTTFAANSGLVSEPIATVYAGYRGEKDKGVWGNDLKIRCYPKNDPNGSLGKLSLEVYYGSALVENFTEISWTKLRERINGNSEFIYMEETDFTKDLTLGVFVGSLSGGTYVKPEEQDFYPDYDTVTGAARGMALFENTEARVLACAEIFTVNFIRECRDLCERLKRFFVFNAPYLATEQVAEQYNNVLVGSDSSFVAGYLNWGEVMDMNSKVWIPCLGYVLGAGFIRKSEMQNGYAWIPPAGVETTSRGFLRMTHSDLTDAQVNRYVVGYRMNVVKYVMNVGNIIWSSRTYSSNTLFESIHIRLMTNWMVEMLPIRNQRFLQRLGTPSLVKEIYADNYVFMRDIYEKGGVENSLDFGESCVINVEIDKQNRKEVDLEIAWIPTECTEAIRIKLNRNDGILLLNN